MRKVTKEQRGNVTCCLKGKSVGQQMRQCWLKIPGRRMQVLSMNWEAESRKSRGNKRIGKQDFKKKFMQGQSVTKSSSISLKLKPFLHSVSCSNCGLLSTHFQWKLLKRISIFIFIIIYLSTLYLLLMLPLISSSLPPTQKETIAAKLYFKVLSFMLL